MNTFHLESSMKNKLKRDKNNGNKLVLEIMLSRFRNRMEFRTLYIFLQGKLNLCLVILTSKKRFMSETCNQDIEIFCY